MKKKLLALTIIMLLGLTVLSACNGENPKPEGGLGDETNPIEEGTEVQEEVENQDDDVIDNEKEDEKPKGQDPKGKEQNEQGDSSEQFVLENDSFKIYEPELKENEGLLVVRGLARVFEATIQYEFEDGHYLFDKGFVTASEGAPGWGEFEIVLDLDEVSNYYGTGTVILYEESAKDGSRLHEIHIPVSLGK